MDALLLEKFWNLFVNFLFCFLWNLDEMQLANII